MTKEQLEGLVDAVIDAAYDRIMARTGEADNAKQKLESAKASLIGVVEESGAVQ